MLRVKSVLYLPGLQPTCFGGCNKTRISSSDHALNLTTV